MTVEQQIDQVVSDDLVLHGWDLARATGQDDTMDRQDILRLWATAQAVPEELMAQYRTPGAFAPGLEVYGPEVHVPASAALQDRLLGLIARDPDAARRRLRRTAWQRQRPRSAKPQSAGTSRRFRYRA